MRMILPVVASVRKMQRNDGLVQAAVFLSGSIRAKLPSMNAKPYFLIAVPLLAAALLGPQKPSPGPSPHSANTPEYTANGELLPPSNYREWVYLTTGFDMSYSAKQSMDHHMFDNVFVNPEAYQAFQKTGTWPDKTMLVLEVRGAKEKGSINQAGHFQDTEVMGLEVHVRDEKRFHGQGNWAFFGFGENKYSKMTPTDAECYSCHAQHAAVDTTFVQFYPTLLPVAQAHQTLSAGYVKDSAKTPEK
jgi:Cytochrome P460